MSDERKRIEISLSTALKIKKRLAGELALVRNKIMANNSRRMEVHCPVVISELLQKEEVLSNALTELRILSAEQNTSSGIAGLLIRMAELKSKISFLRTVPTKEGVQIVDFYSDEQKQVTFVADISEGTKEERLAALQKELNFHQDKVDRLNATTRLTVSDWNSALYHPYIYDAHFNN